MGAAAVPFLGFLFQGQDFPPPLWESPHPPPQTVAPLAPLPCGSALRGRAGWGPPPCVTW